MISRPIGRSSPGKKHGNTRARTTPRSGPPNWAMKDDPECVTAHQRRMAAKEELALASRHEIPKARAVFEAANADWRRITSAVFDRVMAAAGFPQ
jgi:hypothetical protein